MKPRIPEYKNKSLKQRQRKMVQLWWTGEAETKPEAAYMSWMSNSEWNIYNASRAFKRKGAMKELGRLETQMVVNSAKKKEQVVSDIEVQEDEYSKRSRLLLKQLDEAIEAGNIKGIGSISTSLTKLHKMAHDLGQRSDRLNGRNQSDQKNEKDTNMDFLKDIVKNQQKGAPIKQADVTDV